MTATVIQMPTRRPPRGKSDDPGRDGQARELDDLRGFRECVLWLVSNAPAAAWWEGVTKASKARSGLLERNLIACVQRAMPKRAMTPTEADELTRLLASSDLSPETQADLRARAAENPSWLLFSLRRFFRSAGPI